MADSSKPPKPKPMPTTGWPDRQDPPNWSDMFMKRGVSSDRPLEVTNGKKPE